MARRGNRTERPIGPRYFETTSPFETFEPGAGSPRTFKGQTDKTVDVSRRLIDDIAPKVVKGQVNAEQYDNPRGYGGMAMIQFGDEKPKIPYTHKGHSIDHQTEESAKLARTGK